MKGIVMDVLRKIPGGAELEEWFGFMPNFHDFEVVSIDLRRDPEPSILGIHAWRTTDEVDTSGCYVRDRHAAISVIMHGMTQMDISDWNHQNVLSTLEVSESEEGYVVTLNATFGIYGQIAAEKLSLIVEARN